MPRRMMTMSGSPLFGLLVAVLLSVASCSAQSGADITIYAMMEGTPCETVLGRINEFKQNLTDALFLTAALNNYTDIGSAEDALLGNASEMHLMKPIPGDKSIADLIGVVSLGDIGGGIEPFTEVRTGMCMLRVRCSSAATADLLFSLANYYIAPNLPRDAPVSSLGAANPNSDQDVVYGDTPNLVRALGVTSAQRVSPSKPVYDDAVPVPVTAILASALLIGSFTMSACGIRKKLLRKKRVVNFNELVKLEREMHTQMDMKLQAQFSSVTATPGDGLI